MKKRDLSLGRHRRLCSICLHSRCAEIEADFISWRSPATIATKYRLADRSSVYRHAHAFGLFPKRQRNVRAALEMIIEKASEVEVSAAAVVAAIQAYSKINAMGQWVERTETVNLNEIFDRMSAAELEAYARDGTLPSWFTAAKGTPNTTVNPEKTVDRATSIYDRLTATATDSQEDWKHEKP
jgi:hypothetical protein